ncbi:MAG: YraN family protein [Pseudomonadota bacterium]
MTVHVAPDQMLATRKRDQGAQAYFSGCAAEAAVAKGYVARGCALLESRWRGDAGEIDLIFRDGDEVVFVEVKKARSFEVAAERLRPAQARRIHMAASEYLDHTPDGQLSLMRFDLALCNAAGEVDIREGAFSHF